MNNWIQTFTGRCIDPFNFKEDDVSIEDIAHALSTICRFMGHTKIFYSVAQHSIEVSNVVSKEYKFQALLHDASEAYLCDIPRPLKQRPDFDFYRKAEKHIQDTIYSVFGISREDKVIKSADVLILFTEKRDLLNESDIPWAFAGPEPLDKKLIPLSSTESEQLFLKLFRDYI